MRAATAKNLHVPLPPKLYRALKGAAQRQGRPATQVAREAIVQWLANARRLEVEDELRAYVDVTAGSLDDLDPNLELAGIEHLDRSGRRTRHRRRGR